MLADLITQRAKDLDVQIVKAVPLADDARAWEEHKRLVLDIPTDYVGMLNGKLKEEPLNVLKKEYDKNYVITIKFPEYSEKFRTTLQIVELKNGDLFSVNYYAYNQDENIVFERKIFHK